MTIARFAQDPASRSIVQLKTVALGDW